MQRFLEDGQRFPLFNYQSEALLWQQGSQWRVPGASERAQMMGSPPSMGRKA